MLSIGEHLELTSEVKRHPYCLLVDVAILPMAQPESQDMYSFPFGRSNSSFGVKVGFMIR